MSEYEHEIRSFIDRTRKNFETIDALAKGIPAQKKAFEDTQLLCSLIAVTVVPKEKRQLDLIPETSWSAYCTNHNLSPTPNDEISPPEDLRQAVMKLRHAIAHFNIDIKSTDGVISHVRFWNIPCGKEGHPRDFDMTFSRDDLRKLYIDLSKTLCTRLANPGN